jgi:nitrite reductase/ring-hydroxylating ferredoxin subunit
MSTVPAPPRAKRRAPQRRVVARLEDLPAGTRKIVRVGGREIGVFNSGGRLYALRNTCPHQGGPLCLGPVTGTTLPSPPGEYVWGMEGRVLRCPWHGWEFDLETGVGLYDPYRHERVATYEVRVEGDEVVLLA